jgi:hypothetical protein
MDGQKSSTLLDLLAIGECQGGKESPCIYSAQKALSDFCIDKNYDSYALFYSKGFNHDLNDSRTVTMSNYPDGWLKLYSDAKQAAIDPVARCVNMNNPDVFMPYATRMGAFRACMEKPLGNSQDEKDLYKEKLIALMDISKESGRASGLYFTHKLDGHLISLSVTSSSPCEIFDREMDDDKWHQIWRILCEVHVNLKKTIECESCNPRETEAGFFSKAELDILEIVYKHNDTDVTGLSNTLSKSRSTINSQLKRIRDKLNLPYAKPLTLMLQARHRRLI